MLAHKQELIWEYIFILLRVVSGNANCFNSLLINRPKHLKLFLGMETFILIFTELSVVSQTSQLTNWLTRSRIKTKYLSKVSNYKIMAVKDKIIVPAECCNEIACYVMLSNHFQLCVPLCSPALVIAKP